MLNPMFSRKMVLKLERVVQSKADKLIKLMETGIRNRKPVDLHHAFRSVSVDVITDYAFDKSFDLLDSPDLGSKFFTMVRGVGPAMWILQQFEILQDLALKIPPWLAPILSEPLGHVVELQMVNYIFLVPNVVILLTLLGGSQANPGCTSPYGSRKAWIIPTNYILRAT